LLPDSPKDHRKAGIIRSITKVQTNAIELDGCRLDLPKASLIEFTDKGFKIFHPGRRPLTEQEKNLIRNRPVDEKQMEIDCLSDGNVMYWREKAYYHKNNALYLFNGDKNRRLDNQSQIERDPENWMLIDTDVRGELALEYEFI